MSSEIEAHPQTQTQKIIFRMNPNMTGKVENRDKPMELKACSSFDTPTPLLEEVQTLDDFERYLKSYPTQSLKEGNYHNSVPEFLQEDWRKLFDKRAELVKASTMHFWDNYKKYAYGCDELAPLSKKCKNNWGGVGMTLIDSLDTLWIMDLKDEFEEAVNYVRMRLV